MWEPAHEILSRGYRYRLHEVVCNGCLWAGFSHENPKVKVVAPTPFDHINDWIEAHAMFWFWTLVIALLAIAWILFGVRP